MTEQTEREKNTFEEQKERQLSAIQQFLFASHTTDEYAQDFFNFLNKSMLCDYLQHELCRRGFSTSLDDLKGADFRGLDLRTLNLSHLTKQEFLDLVITDEHTNLTDVTFKEE